MDVTEPGRQQGQAQLPVQAGGAGVEDRLNGEGVSEVGDPGRPDAQRGAGPARRTRRWNVWWTFAVDQPGPRGGHQQESRPRIHVAAVERAIASPTLIPVTPNSPIKVANVARRSGVRSETVAAINAAMSVSEYG